MPRLGRSLPWVASLLSGRAPGTSTRLCDRYRRAVVAGIERGFGHDLHQRLCQLRQLHQLPPGKRTQLAGIQSVWYSVDAQPVYATFTGSSRSYV